MWLTELNLLHQLLYSGSLLHVTAVHRTTGQLCIVFTTFFFYFACHLLSRRGPKRCEQIGKFPSSNENHSTRSRCSSLPDRRDVTSTPWWLLHFFHLSTPEVFFQPFAKLSLNKTNTVPHHWRWIMTELSAELQPRSRSCSSLCSRDVSRARSQSKDVAGIWTSTRRKTKPQTSWDVRCFTNQCRFMWLEKTMLHPGDATFNWI